MAAISTASSFIFTSPNSKSSSQPISTSSVKYSKRIPISVSAVYTTTAERTASTNEKETVRSLRNTCSSSLYEVLGVRIGADTLEVKSAYRKLARILHPDVGTHDSSADEFMKVHSAYVTLMDPEKRADYDRTLFHRRKATSLRSSGGYKSRRWETDQCW